jgi:DNA repair exonuclease SbcCD nuclease subunit
MSKAVIVGDMHIGSRNASNVLTNFQLKFFEEQVLPYMKKNKIKTILQTGDIFDTRKYSNHVVLNEWKKRFFDVLAANKIELHIVLGNHDLALKNTLAVNTPTLFLSEYSNVIVYDKPTEVQFGDLKFLMVPWICSENSVQCAEAMEQSDALYCMGHFEFDNFEMHRGQIHTGGMQPLKKFQQIISGHFHTRSSKDNVLYVGTPYEMTWIDYDDPKGFHVLDTKTQDLEFIENKFTLFNKVHYNDKDQSDDYFKEIDLSSIENGYTKIVVVNKTDLYQFDRFMDRVYNIPTADLKIVEDMMDIDSNIDDDELELEDTTTLISSYIDQIDTELDKEKLKTMMKTLYVGALEVLD